MLTQNFGVTKKEHYGMLRYFLECSMKLKHIVEQATNGQAPGGCYPSMPPINITVAGVEKLLNKLNPCKAPGPDNLRP